MAHLGIKSEKSLHIATLPPCGITTSMGEKFAYEKKEVKEKEVKEKEVKSTTHQRSTSEVESTSPKKHGRKKS